MKQKGIALKYQRYHKGHQRHPYARLFRKWFQGFICVLVFFAVSYCVIWCLDPLHFPITSVKFIGVRHHLSQEALREIVLPEIKVGFFRLKVSALKSRLLALPWIRQADVRKIWPDQLIISFEEHTPAACWGKNGMISESGVLFSPLPFKIKQKALPMLQGPEGKSRLVWEQYLVMEKTLAPLKLNVTSLVLAPRGAWHLELSNGISVVLGTNDILQRLERFVTAYKKHLYKREQEISYVDMRYTSGMAVGWKS